MTLFMGAARIPIPGVQFTATNFVREGSQGSYEMSGREKKEDG